jgi:ligand-binding sensor domain-containing protein
MLAALALSCASQPPAPAPAEVAVRAVAEASNPNESPRVVEAPRRAEVVEPKFTGDIVTDVRDVRACLPLDGGAVLAGTGGGLLLVRADGTVRAPWTALDGLPETRVHALLREGERVWIGTEAGLARGRLRDDDLVVERTIAGNPVRAILRHEGALFAATWGGGIVRVDEKRSRFVAILSGETRFSALAAHQGTLFAGGASGLVRVDEGKALPVAGSPGSIWTLASHGGLLWIGGLGGLASLAEGRLGLAHDADVRALLPAGDALLAGTLGQGVLEVRDGAVQPLPELAQAPLVQAAGAAGETRCVGGPDGLFVQRGAGARWEAIRVPELASNDVSALARDGERLWIGSFDRGLSFLERGRVTRIRDTAIDDKVNGLAVEARPEGARVWVATARGLSVLEPRAGSPKVTRYGELDGLPAADVHAVVALSAGGVLAGTARGAVIVRDGQVTALGEKRGLPPGAVWAVAEGAHGALLLGTSRGLLMGTAESRGVVDRGAPPRDVSGVASDGGPPPAPWLLLSMASGDLEDDWVTALASRGKTLYVGTYNAGVTAVTMDGDGLASEQLGGGYVNFGGLLVRGRTLFAATMNGLLMRPATGEGTWKSAPRAAPGRDVTALAPDGDRLWVASRRGLSRFDPG